MNTLIVAFSVLMIALMGSIFFKLHDNNVAE